jgi:hypothetical protein
MATTSPATSTTRSPSRRKWIIASYPAAAASLGSVLLGASSLHRGKQFLGDGSRLLAADGAQRDPPGRPASTHAA